ncbi:MAG: hypothetical protein JNL57_02025 [Bacteroidetes bacterium]|nr:hypothetical protein [Bacteroidota bacterium]
MKRLIPIALLFGAISAQAQDLTIRYNFLTDEYHFFQGNKEVKQPVIKRNYQVRVEVDNMNPFVYVARCNWKKEVVDDNSSSTISAISSILPGVTMPGGGIGKLLTALKMETPEDAKERGGAPSLLKDNPFARVAFDNVLESYNNLYQIDVSVNNIRMATAKLKSLKYNPYMPGDTLKNLARQMVLRSLYPVSNSDNLPQYISATTFMNLSNNISSGMNDKLDILNTNANSLISYYNQFSASNTGNVAEIGLDKKVRDLQEKAKLLKERYTADSISKYVDLLEEQYESITYTPYKYNCDYMATGDMVSLTLDFFESSRYNRTMGYAHPGGDFVDTLRKIRTKSMNVMVRGDMKINTSIGLGFPTYFGNNKIYSNRDSVITGTPGNNFSPCISTFVNFYPYVGHNAHLGGSFGVGLPVQSEGTSSLNFFLGGSAILGAANKVVINAGLAVGQLPGLSKGLKIGDKLANDYVEPTTQKTFKTGAFFGISFAIGK